MKNKLSLHPINRRQLIKTGFGASAFLYANSFFTNTLMASVFSETTKANSDTATTEPQFFLQIYMDGGWDTTLSTDVWTFQTPPDEKMIYAEYRKEDLLPLGNRFLGPACAPLMPFFDRLTIFNGVSMSPVEVGHPSPVSFALNGVPDSSDGNFSYQFMRSLYNPDTQGVVSNTSIEMGSNLYKNSEISGISKMLEYNSNDESDLDGNSLIDSAKADLAKSSLEIKKLAQINQSYLSTNADERNLCLGFLSLTYPCASITVRKGFLDTHNNHVNAHKKSLTDNFQDAANYLSALAKVPWGRSGKSLLDLTTVVIVSEFTRTPALNLSGGKDHNPYSNSMIVIDSRFKKGIFGASRLVEGKYSPSGTSAMVAMALDKKTFMPIMGRENTFMLKPWTIYGDILRVRNIPDEKLNPMIRQSPSIKGLWV